MAEFTPLVITSPDGLAPDGSNRPINMSGYVGRAITTFTPAVTGGTGPKMFKISGRLPTGLSFNAATGAISGTPTEDSSRRRVAVSVEDNFSSATIYVNIGIAADYATGRSNRAEPPLGPTSYSIPANGTYTVFITGLAPGETVAAVSNGTFTANSVTSALTIDQSITVTTSLGRILTLTAAQQYGGGAAPIIVAIPSTDEDIQFIATKFPTIPAAFLSSLSYDASKGNLINTVTSSFDPVTNFLPVIPTVSDATYDVFYTARNSGANGNSGLTEAAPKATYGNGIAGGSIGLMTTKATVMWDVQQTDTLYRGANGFVGVAIPSVPLFALINKYPAFKKRLHAATTTDTTAWTYTTTAQASVYYHATGANVSNMFSLTQVAGPSNAGAYPTGTIDQYPGLTEVTFNADLSTLAVGQYMFGTGANGQGIYVRGLNNEDYSQTANQALIVQGTGITGDGFLISRAGGVDFTVIIDGFHFLGGATGARFALTSATTGIRPKLIFRNCWFGAGNGTGNSLTVIGGFDCYFKNCSGISSGSDVFNFHDFNTTTPTVDNSPRAVFIDCSPRDAALTAKAGTATSPNDIALHDLCFGVFINTVAPTAAQVNVAGELTGTSATPAVVLGSQFGNNNAAFSPFSGYTDCYFRAGKFWGLNTIGGSVLTRAKVRNMTIGTDIALSASAVSAGATIANF